MNPHPKRAAGFAMIAALALSLLPLVAASASDADAQSGILQKSTLEETSSGDATSENGAPDVLDDVADDDALIKIIPRSGNPPTYKRAVINKSKALNYVDRTQVISSCRVLRDGGTCTISIDNGVSRTIGVALDISRNSVASALNISASQTVSYSVSTACTSPKMKKNETWKAYPEGNRHKYKIEQKKYINGLLLETKTSGWQYAFDPIKNRYACG